MRLLIVFGAAVVVGCASWGTPRLERVSIQSELKPDEQAEHVLNRLAYGPRPGDLQRVRDQGIEKWIARQLSPETIQDAAADQVLSGYRTLSVPSADLVRIDRAVQTARRQAQREMAAAGDTGTRRDARRDALMDNPALREDARTLQLAVGELTTAKLARAAVSERQLYEHMVDFWENHFSVFVGKGQTRLFLSSYDRDVIRPRALGKFRDLLGAVAHSPAMLFYLDNFQSAADSTHRTLVEVQRGRVRGMRPQGARPRGLNENYARELMELHTLGVDGGYTQQDVVEVARALTGWSIDQPAGAFVFRPAVHDADEKTVLGVKLAAGRGVEDGEQVLDILAKHPSTAKHITRKLAVRFVSDAPPEALVDRCAAEFTKSDGDIRRTLQCVVTSPEFFSRAAYRAKVKTPFELVASAMRATGAVPDQTPRSAQLVTRLGQPIFGRQTPDGWPDKADEWLNSGAMVNRVNFGLQMATRRVPGLRFGEVDASVSAMLSTPEFQRR
jgi:uncharacterized protein (DUF1800 family)